MAQCSSVSSPKARSSARSRWWWSLPTTAPSAANKCSLSAQKAISPNRFLLSRWKMKSFVCCGRPMMKPELEEVLRDASTGVLETMFFADVTPVADSEAVHEDALVCGLVCSGAENGRFSVAVDRAALGVLSEAFYGDEGEPSATREAE